jgi:transposase
MHRTKDARLKLRIQIVLLWSAGRSSREIADALGCAVSTALCWAHRFVADGEAGLVDRRSENGPTKVDLDLLQAVAEMIQETPTGSGWQRSTWTRELIALELEERTGVRLGVTTIGRVLKRLGARWGRPRPIVKCPWSRQRKAARMAKIRSATGDLPEDEVLLYQDEVEIHLNPKIGRDWMLSRRQKAALTPGQNVKRHVAGALDAKTGRLVWVWGNRRDSALFIDHLRALAKAYRRAAKIHLIVDNCSAHDSKATREALKTDELDRITLHFLPPYCPFENRIEMLWKQLHANVTRNHSCASIDELARRVDHFLIAAQPWPGAKPSIAPGPDRTKAA